MQTPLSLLASVKFPKVTYQVRSNAEALELALLSARSRMMPAVVQDANK